MKRDVKLIVSSLFLVLCLIMTGMLTTTSTAAPKEKTFRLKYADWDPPPSIFSRAMREPWAKLIEKETGGRVKIDIFGSSTLVKAPDMHDALINGIADIALEGAQFMPGRMPLTELGFLPFLFKSSMIASLSMWEANNSGAFGDEWAAVKVLSWRGNAPNNIVSIGKPVKTLEDWKGRKFRASGSVMNDFSKLMNAVPVQTSVAEMSDSLAKRYVEIMLLDWEAHWVFKTFDVSKYRTDMANVMVSAGINYAMSWKTYNSLPPDIQAVFDKYSGEWLCKLTGANMDREAAVSKQLIMEKDKTAGEKEWYTLPEEERKSWIAAVEPLYDKYVQDLEKKGLPGRATLNKLKELSAKYEAMYPPGSDKEYALWQEFGMDAVFPGYPEGFVMPKR